ncbi:MAG: Pyrimidine-specific ribonucleoside hydrolase RihA [Chlamydiia bacterium]|nr:Pyrimidine-specific ribonucleoside hydrolase RihA [Chlamydiia bacterium]
MDANDLYTLYLLAKTKRADLIGVSINGSKAVHIEKAPELAENVLYLANRTDIPVSSILSSNFCVNNKVKIDWNILVRSPEAYKLPKSPAKPLPLTSPELMYDLIKKSKSKVTLLGYGPLNNIAHFISEYPDALDRIERIVLLGGALHTTESVTIPYDVRWKATASYNLAVDPCASNIVFTSGIPITLIPLDITNLIPINKLVIDKYEQKPTNPGAEFVMNVLKNSVKKKKEKTLTPAWDMVGIMAIIHPEMIKTVKLSLKVITEEGPSFGKLVESNEGNTVEVCTYIRQEEFYRNLFNMINR